jgi:hypothetical protein
MGDVNSDGVVMGDDALLMLRYCMELASASMLDLSVADVTNDSCYGADDALLILRYTLDLIDHL